MLERHSNRRSFPVDRHAGAMVAGVAADGRAIGERAQRVGGGARTLCPPPPTTQHAPITHHHHHPPPPRAPAPAVQRATGEASNYKAFYGSPIPGRVLAERIASFVHVFNLYW